MTNTQSTPTTDLGGIQQVIRALRADGWKLDYVWDGCEAEKVSTEPAATDAIMAVDEARLYVRRNGERGYVYFVLGNDPDEVVCDYTTNLTAVDDVLARW